MSEKIDLNLDFPGKLKPLFQPYPYKVLYGGRSGMKSWTAARTLLLLGAQRQVKVLCCREIQKSIDQSVHQLLKNQIGLLGLSKIYEVLNTEIVGRNGTEFVFAGLQSHTVESIKSYEGVDYCWVEEANNVSEYSWKILLPTIRKPGSEIWITFNPELDTDPTYKRFVLNTPPNAFKQYITYQDLPPEWVSEETLQKIEHDRSTLSEEEFNNIWLGIPRTSVDGAIYSNEIARAVQEGRITHVPYDPSLKVHAVWDMGWNDSMAIIMVQRVRSELRIIDYIEESHKTLDWYVSELNARHYNWGYDFLPHDAFNKDYKTGQGADFLLRKMGRKVKPKESVVQMSVENGIRTARMAFNQAVFDRNKCERLIECLKRYRRNFSQKTEEFGAPLHDSHSHGADCWRYTAINADLFRNEDEEDTIEYSSAFRPSVAGMSY